MTIKSKLVISVSTLSVIILGMFLLTYRTTRAQKYDGLVINLAGRQRMLTQKLTKEVLQLASHAKSDSKPDQKLIAYIKNTAGIFEKTLSAVTESGEAPTTLDLASTKTRFCPKAQEPAYSQLVKVKGLWSKYKGHLDTFLLDPVKSRADLAWMLNNNIALLKDMNKAVGMLQSQSEAKVSQLLIFMLIGIGFGAVATVFVIRVVMNITRRLEKVKEFAEKLSTGDLKARLGLKGQDELTAIGVVLDAMADNIGVMVKQIGDNAGMLSNSSGQLVQIAHGMAGGAEDVSGRSSTVAAATEQMSANMQSVAAAIEQASTNVNIVSNATGQMTSAISEIAQNTERATAITQEAVGEAQNASSMVNQLGQAANEINKVTETITEISEQTNLLALNATIEAARAGDAGKGFAVVASEIKDLANQTAKATEDIRNKIEGIQNSTTTTVDGIEKITNIISEVNDIVSTIATAVEEQSMTTNEIAGNMGQASQGIDEVNENVAQTAQVASSVANDISGVHQVASDVSSSSSQLQESAKGLSSLAAQLNELVGQYQL